MNDGLRRLKILAEVVLPTVNEEDFDLAQWKCKTTACAVGYACLYEPFKDEGLRLVESHYKTPTVLIPSYEDCIGMGAAAKFFGLSIIEAEHLFIDTYYKQESPTVQDVIMKIQEVIERKEDEERFKQTRGTS